MKVEFEGQVPKDLSYPELNEDVRLIASDRSLMVLCDGASESFASKTWATILADKFLHEQVIDPAWVDDAISKYKAQFDRHEMSWSKQAAFERGSFSTFLTVTYSASGNHIEIIGIGDSIALLLHGDEIIDSFPYISAEEFKNRPELFSTNLEHNRFLFSADFITQHKKIWNIDKSQLPRLLLMTDALAEWTLRGIKENNQSLEKLLQIGNISEFKDLILSERNAKNMRIDDSTLIKVIFDGE